MKPEAQLAELKRGVDPTGQYLFPNPGGPTDIGAADMRLRLNPIIRVSDDGCGIPPEDLDRIFQPFFTTKAPGEGTGLGLAVAYGLVGGWGGRLEVASTVGAGTTMSIHVPLAEGVAVGDEDVVPLPEQPVDVDAGMTEVTK